MLGKWLQVVGGLILLLFGTYFGYVCGKLYEVSRGDNTCFILVGFLAMIYGNMRYSSILKWRARDAIIGLVTTVGFGLAIGIGATFYRKLLLGLALAATYYAFLLLIIRIRYANGEREIPHIVKTTTSPHEELREKT